MTNLTQKTSKQFLAQRAASSFELRTVQGLIEMRALFDG